jgi:MoaA/NifB/PqqE/SkfB family radical SAM enzyme
MSYKTIPIVAVRPVEEYFILTWQVDLKCNFDCMYCPPNFHNLTSSTKSLEELKSSWLKVYNASRDKNLKYKINFTGGEISLSKSFLNFIKWLRKNYNDQLFQVGVGTNGSASSKYYLELIEYVDFITFSTHSEFFNEKKFFENVLACKTKIQGTEKTVQVSVMNEPWHAERTKTYIKFFNLQNISYSLNEIDFNMKTRDKHKINKNKNLYNFDET